MALAHGVQRLGRGDQLFDRRCKIIVAAPVTDSYKRTSTQVVEASDLRVTFEITKTTESKPNPSRITIYNLAERSRAGMQAKGARVILQAGYETTLGTIFLGDARIIDHRHEGPDWVTSIEAGDGERAFRHARISDSHQGRVSKGKALKKVVEAMGIAFGSQFTGVVAEADKTDAYENGWAAHGRASTELTRILTGLGYDWSIQDGTLQLQKFNTPISEMAVLDANSGLIGTPEHGTAASAGKPATLKFRSLLRHDLRAGGKVKLESLQHKGVYMIKRLVHTGDTHGNDWYSDIEGTVVS